MGCLYKISNQSCVINNTIDVENSIAVRTGNITTAVSNNNFSEICNDPTQDISNDNCQQQQNSGGTKAKKTHTTLTASQTSNKTNDELEKATKYITLEYQNRLPTSSQLRSIEVTEQEEDSFQETSIKCYPLAYHNKGFCQRHNNFGAFDSRNNLDFLNTCGSNNDIIGKNCNCSCRCRRCPVSFFSHKQRKTQRHEMQCERNNIGADADEKKHKMHGSVICSSEDRCLHKSWSFAKNSLTSTALEFKNSIMNVMEGSCASLVQPLIRTIIRQCSAHCSNIYTNNNNNKSEPYSGYCQSKRRASESEYIPTYTSTNTCCLHDGIRSSHHLEHNRNNVNTSRKNNHLCGNNSNICHAAAPGSHSAAAEAHTVAFNYIGHNYYHFLRNSINFYTASVILVLCYLTTTTSAAATKSETTSVDKHPMMQGDYKE